MNIILIGPVGIGKSTIGKILAEKLELDIFSLDDLYKNETRELGIDRMSEDGRLYIVKKAIEEFGNKNCILDFGAFHSFSFSQQEHNNEVERILLPFENVILLTPSEEKEESKEYLFNLNQSCQKFSQDDIIKIKVQNSLILESPQNQNLAKKIVYTKEKNVEDIANEIVNLFPNY